MTSTLSDDSRAIILLTASLSSGATSGDTASPAAPLSLTENQALADYLHSHQQTPKDLLSHVPDITLKGKSPKNNRLVDAARLHALLDRTEKLDRSLKRWGDSGIWVISRADAVYPKRLKRNMGKKAPPVLYGRGDLPLLNCRSLGIVGPRKAQQSLLNYTAQVAQLAVRSNFAIVSGWAQGTDQAAMRSAIDEGGFSYGVSPHSLETSVQSSAEIRALDEGRFALVSLEDPASHFHQYHLMARNPVIYALADSVLVMNIIETKGGKPGGTWHGASRHIKGENHHQVPIFVRNPNTLPDQYGVGLTRLRKMGAMVWPDPIDMESFHNVMMKKHDQSTEPNHNSSTLSLFDADQNDSE